VSSTTFPKKLSRRTNHSPARYQIYQPGFNRHNSCWLKGEWITLPRTEWLAKKAKHEVMYAAIREAAKRQTHCDPGTSLKSMSTAQRQAHKFYSGTRVFKVKTANGRTVYYDFEIAGGQRLKRSSEEAFRKAFPDAKLIPDEFFTHRGFRLPADLVSRRRKSV
jgi:hypothetical protein